ncbi:ATP-dependent DNA helicase RecG [Desulfonatronum thiosulfatophilum]|uniref:ATP-dependent DNA helicase RecG n=1 Tax=Desulfonatronum thiosulfatophilum TaxID=617002 RepID=A0A1G6AMD0_9BACT|nr:ATP-binding protein [Desulfonatronum thiosulfatophilum]SDB09525.1 ATP-dependent DNA helicase RecG [Desulfonatronum thiosulfatophilum]
MNQKTLHNLLALGEGFTTEFKRSGTSNLGREICAFANATGGMILIGVTDAGEIVGVNDHNRLKSEVQAVARSAEPPIAVEIESVGEVLTVRVPAQHGKPYSFGGKFFIREGASSQQMSRSEIREFFYAEGLIHFDETPCERFSLADDLTDEVWERFRRRARIPADMQALTALENLHLVKDGKVTHAGAWLLARDITKFNTSAAVACALFMGTDKVRILDRRGFSEDIYSMIDQVMDWILSKINVEYIIKHVKREERPELPEEAMREAVVNALVHRDYRSTASVHVYLFKDRLEIVSPGGLPAGMTEADLGTKSIPRNPLLFAMLHRMEAVEHIGSGIKRIRNLCREYGVAEPKIEVSEHWFTVVFPRQELPESDRQAESSRDQFTSQEDQVGTKSGPSKDQVKILRHCETESAMGDLMGVLGRTNRTKFRDQVLAPLLEAELVEMTVPDKPRSSKQRYRLTAKGREFLAVLEQPR